MQNRTKTFISIKIFILLVIGRCLAIPWHELVKICHACDGYTTQNEPVPESMAELCKMCDM